MKAAPRWLPPHSRQRLLNCLAPLSRLHGSFAPYPLTTPSRICVLDFGLMTEVTPEQRVALVEYIAHLSTQVRGNAASGVICLGCLSCMLAFCLAYRVGTALAYLPRFPHTSQPLPPRRAPPQDWEKLALDLQTLGFIPPEVDTQQAGLVEPLGRVMSQLVGGGGASKVNIDKVRRNEVKEEEKQGASRRGARTGWVCSLAYQDCDAARRQNIPCRGRRLHRARPPACQSDVSSSSDTPLVHPPRPLGPLPVPWVAVSTQPPLDIA